MTTAALLTAVLLAQAPATPPATPPAGQPAAGAPAKAPEKKEPAVAALPFNKATVGDVIQGHLAEIQGCYEEAMAAQGSTGKNAPGGTVTMAWMISTDGLCTDVKVKKSQIKDGQVTACIATAISAWEFPKPEKRTPMEVPFALKPTTGVEKSPDDPAKGGKK
jgi:hypothetical protein